MSSSLLCKRHRSYCVVASNTVWQEKRSQRGCWLLRGWLLSASPRIACRHRTVAGRTRAAFGGDVVGGWCDAGAIRTVTYRNLGRLRRCCGLGSLLTGASAIGIATTDAGCRAGRYSGRSSCPLPAAVGGCPLPLAMLLASTQGSGENEQGDDREYRLHARYLLEKRIDHQAGHYSRDRSRSFLGLLAQPSLNPVNNQWPEHGQ